ncbi:MAG TPA: biopolymer transporter ExbD [Sphingomonadaceae bacterium]|nr:biopolymer transporter ExbD [Sphingomonadaceae bacterium]
MAVPRVRYSTNKWRNAQVARPIWEINTTPLIDILLVLLIMLIITIPMPPHSLDVDLPGRPPIGTSVEKTVNKIVVTRAGAIEWNGREVTEDGLVVLLHASKANPDAELHFEPEANAAYGTSANVIRLIKEQEIEKFAFVGNQKFRAFPRGD